MYGLNSISITAKKDEVLKILRKNRELHAKIVQEARAGYCDKAGQELSKRLDRLKHGKITSLVFALKMPVDQTSVYDTAIKMLEMHTGETISLSGGEVRNLIEDKWDWSHEFYVSNSAYSGTAQARFGEVAEDPEEP
jgi:hypothetical protein